MPRRHLRSLQKIILAAELPRGLHQVFQVPLLSISPCVLMLPSHMVLGVGADSSDSDEGMDIPLSSRLPKVAAKDNTGSRAAKGAAPAVSGTSLL